MYYAMLCMWWLVNETDGWMYVMHTPLIHNQSSSISHSIPNPILGGIGTIYLIYLFPQLLWRIKQTTSTRGNPHSSSMHIPHLTNSAPSTILSPAHDHCQQQHSLHWQNNQHLVRHNLSNEQQIGRMAVLVVWMMHYELHVLLLLLRNGLLYLRGCM